LAIVTQSGEFLDELELAELSESGQGSNVLIGKPDLAGPPATGGAALALVKELHSAWEGGRPPAGFREMKNHPVRGWLESGWGL